MPNDFAPQPLGKADHLRSELSKIFNALDWNDPAWGVFRGDGFSFEFNFQKAGVVEQFMLHVRGGGDAVPPIVAMCKHFGWKALDCSEGDFIDLDHPSTSGWEGFQAFRDQVVNNSPPPRADG